MNTRIQQALDGLIQVIQEETVAGLSALLNQHRIGNGQAVAGGRSAANVRRNGGKRTADELATFKTRVLGVIKMSPGLRTEEIAKQLGATTKELQLPMRQLREEKLIRMKGEKRAASYSA
jgi:hypothetical protein